MGLAEIKTDSKLNRQRVAAMDLSKLDRNGLAKFIKDELAENVWPFMEALVEAAQAENKVLEEACSELNEAVDELEAGGDEDMLFPETAEQILAVLQLGQQIAIGIAPALRGGKLDEMKRKKLLKMCAAYRQGVEVVGEIILAITVEADKETPDGEAGEAGEDAAAEGEPEDDAAAVGDEDDDGEGEADDGFDQPAGGEGG